MDRLVEPGQTGEIPIQFDTVGNNGPVGRQVTVTCNVPNQPSTRRGSLEARSYRPVDFNPPMALLNLPPDGESASMVVTITNNTDEPLALSDPEINNNGTFTAQLTTNTPGKSYQLKVSVVPPVPAGYVPGQISLRTGWTNPAVVTLPVGASVQPPIVVIPTYITLAVGTAGERRDKLGHDPK